MASKDKAPEAEDGAEKPDGEGGEPKKSLLKKLLSKKILMIAVPALVLVLVGGGAGAYFFLAKPHDAEGEQHAKAEEIPLTPPEVAFSEVPSIMVNIQSNDGTPSYLK